VLEPERSIITHRERRVLAIEPPENIARGPVDVVDSMTVPGRDEEVAFAVLFSRVDVEVVPGLKLGSVGRGRRYIAFVGRDVVQ
jgi:hypothetical protein